MYTLLKDIAGRPKPFSRYTAKELWTRPHLARQMLAFHLGQESDLASRRLETIDRTVDWIDSMLNIRGKTVCDLGCGPGLYTQRFADRGAQVTGVDFSAHSLEYARQKAVEFQQAITYLDADYLSDELPAGFDIVTLIYTDYCVLSPPQRITLLARIATMLKPGGHLVMDVAGTGSLHARCELTSIENKLMNGFWAEGDYVGIHRAFVYQEERLALDRYVIIEPSETWQIFNWFQFFTTESLSRELEAAGFSVENMVGDLTGRALEADGDFIGAVAIV